MKKNYQLPPEYFHPWGGLFSHPQLDEIQQERRPKKRMWLQKQLKFNHLMNEAMRKEKKK